MDGKQQLHEAMAACRRAYIGVGAFSLCINALMLASPIYMMQVYDRVIATGNIDTLVLLTLMVVASLAVLATLEGLRGRVMTRVANWLDRRLAPVVLSGAVAETIRSHGVPSAQGLRDLATVRGYIGGQGVFPLFDAPWVPVFLFVIFLVHPMLGWVSVAGAVALFALALANEFTTRRPLSQASGAASRALNQADAAVRNADVIAAMGMLPALVARWRDGAEKALVLQTRASDMGGIVTSAAKFVRLLLQVAILGVGAYYVIAHEMTGGAMIAASIIMGRALAPVEQLIAAWRSFVGARTAYSRLAGLIERAPPLGGRMTLPAPEGRIEVDRVSFAPQGVREPILKQVSFALAPGEALGLIGPSAAGKTTLVRLLVGSLLPSAGHVRLDGADVAGWDLADRGRHIGYLPQMIELFAGSVRDNIARLGEAEDAAVVEAARLAGAHDLILGLPQGYDTPIGDGGVPISGGQRQRIGLARAVFGNPRLVVLDEPNSHLDAAGEQALVEAVVGLKKAGATIVLIAQRAGVMAQMDKILLLRAGAVEAFGPRDEILAKLGLPVAAVGAGARPSGPPAALRAAPPPVQPGNAP
ncbi:MAG: type I secretion system permease/ATPase [Alphaproteobacteria bacterium]